MTELGQELLKPSSQYYTTPGGATEAAKIHAVKEATFLSQMDQFYTSLEETKREFDLAFEQRGLFHTEDLAFQREQLEVQEEYGTRSLDLKEREISRRYAGPTQQEFDLAKRGMTLQEKESKTLRTTYENVFGLPPGRGELTPGTVPLGEHLAPERTAYSTAPSAKSGKISLFKPQQEYQDIDLDFLM